MNLEIAKALVAYHEDKMATNDNANTLHLLDLLENLGKTRAVKTVVGGLIGWCERIVKKAFGMK